MSEGVAPVQKRSRRRRWQLFWLVFSVVALAVILIGLATRPVRWLGSLQSRVVSEQVLYVFFPERQYFGFGSNRSLAGGPGPFVARTAEIRATASEARPVLVSLFPASADWQWSGNMASRQTSEGEIETVELEVKDRETVIATYSHVARWQDRANKVLQDWGLLKQEMSLP